MTARVKRIKIEDFIFTIDILLKAGAKYIDAEINEELNKLSLFTNKEDGQDFEIKIEDIA